MKINTKQLNKFTAIMIMTLFLGTMFYVSPENPLIDISEEPQINEQITDSKFIDDSVIESPTRSVIEFNQIYSGESIKTDIEFNKQSFDTSYFYSLYQYEADTGENFFPQYSVFLHDYSYMFTDDDSYANFGFSIDSPITTSVWVTAGRLTVKIKADGDGTFYYNLRANSVDTSANYYSILTPTLSGSVSVSQSELDYEGYYYLQIYLYYEVGLTFETLRLRLYKETTDGKTQLGSHVDETSTITLGANSIFAEIDEFYFVRDTITNNVRSEVQYTGPTVKTISIDIPSIPHAKEIRVYTDFDYSSINPTATVTRVSDYWKIASPVEITYKMLFLSTCQNHLAIKEVSTSFLTDISFETGNYLNDWLVDYGDLSLNTQVSFDGFSSLDVGGVIEYFEESSDACDFEEDVEEFDIKLNGLDTIDRFEQYDEWKLRLYEAGGGTNLGARRDNLAINTDDYTVFTSEIYTSGTSVDRVKITLHFSDASTQDFVELIPAYTMEEFSFDITAGKIIDKIDIYYGSSTWYAASGDRIYVSYIEIKQVGSEISLTLPENNYYFSYAVYLQTGTMTLTTDDQTVVNDGSVTDRWITEFVFTHTDTVTLTTTLTDFDLTNFFDNFRIFTTSTTIKTFGYSESMIESTLLSWDGYKNPILERQQTLNTTLLERSSQTVEYTTNLTSTSGFFELNYNQALEQKEYEIYTYSYSSGEFNNCSYYFTPSVPTHTDYAETELLDAWDFSEGDEEGFSIYDNSYYRSIAFGMDICIQDETFVFMKQRKALDLNSEYYNQLEIRIFSNRTTPHLQIHSYNNLELYYGANFLSNTWTIITIDLSDHNGWTDVAGLMFRYATTNAWEMYTIDYIELFHKCSFLQETNDYFTDIEFDTLDFEEGKEESEFFNFTQGSHIDNEVYENGYYQYETIGAAPNFGWGSRWAVADDTICIDSLIYNFLIITLWTDSSATNNILFYAFNSIGTSKIPAEDRLIGYAVTNEIVTLTLDLSQISGWSGDVYGIRFDTGENTGDLWRIYDIKLLHQEEMPYTTIQNYAGIESESMDYLYNVWVDFNYFGVYQDPSLVPLIIDTVGTHFISVQPFKTDDCYITQNIYTWTYRVSLVDNYYTFLSYDYDLEGSINLVIKTFWANQTIDVWHNTTQLLNDEAEGDITTFYAVSQGYHEITVKVYNGAELWNEFVFGFKIILPESQTNYVTALDYYVDVAAGLIYTNVMTYWGNQTIRVADNGTWKGDAIAEGAGIWGFTASYGFHNVTIHIYNDAVEQWVFSFGFTIIEPSADTNYIESLNYDVDISAGLVYVHVLTHWGNQTVRVADNSSWLGSGVGEGASIWSFTPTYGYHNITIHIYNGASEEWLLVFSFTIVAPESPEFFFEFFDYEVDVIAGQIYVNVITNWSNQTIRVKDNTTWLGSAQSEGATIWSFNSGTYGMHNISIYVYNGASEEFIFVFSFTIVEPTVPEGLIIYVWNKELDIANGQIYVNIITNWNNQSIRVKDNTTWLGDYQDEGASIWTFTTSYGLHNISIWLLNGTTEIFVEYFSFTIVAPESPAELIIEVWNKDVDLVAGFISVNILTSWANQTIRVSDNGTWLGNYAGEGTSIWTFTVDYGFHNITIGLYNGTTLIFVECFSFTIVEPAITIWTVHFDIITTTGVGLPFETCKIIVNDSRIYSNEKYYLDGAYLEIQAFDFYDNLLYETTRTITNNVDISLVVPFNLQTFENPYEVFVRMTLYDSHRDGSANQTWDISPHSSLTLFMMSSSYNILVTPLDTEINNGTHIIYYTSTLREYVDLAYKENVYTITVDTWAEELEGQEEILEKQLKQAQLVVIWETVFLAMMLAVISMLIKWGAIKCINFVLIPFMRVLRILFGLQPKILVRDAGGLRFISLDQWEKYQLQQEKGVV